MKKLPTGNSLVHPGLPSSLPCLALAILTLVMPVSSKGATVWSADFAGYANDETIIGKDGWAISLIDSDNNTDAFITSHPKAKDGKVLKLLSTSGKASSQRRTHITNTFEKVTGPEVEVSISVAFDWIGTSTSAAAFAFNLAESNSPVLIGFSATQGLYFNGTYNQLEESTILAASQVAHGEFYDFKFVFNFDRRVFNLTISGVDSNNNVFNYSISDVGFRSNTPTSMNGIDSVKLMNGRGDYIQYYIDGIEIRSIPEPSMASVIILGGGTLLAGYSISRQNLASPRSDTGTSLL